MTDPLEGFRARDDLTPDEAELHRLQKDGVAAGIDPEDMRRIILGQDCVSFDTGTLTEEEWARLGTELKEQAKQNIAVFTETAFASGLDHPDTRTAYDEARGGAFMMGYINGFLRNYQDIEKHYDEQRNNET